MEAVLIFRQPLPSELAAIEEKLQHSSCLVVTGPGLTFPGAATLPSFIASKANHDLLESILAMGDRKMGESTLAELLNQGNFPIWHYQRFRIFFILKPLFVLRGAVEHYLNEGCRLSVYCTATHPDSLKGFGADTNLIIGESSVKQKLNFTALISYSVYFAARVLLSLLFRPDLKNKQHLLIDRAVRQQCRHFETLALKQDNYLLSNLLDKSGDDFLIIAETETPKYRGSGAFRLRWDLFAGLGRRRRTVNAEYIIFKGLLSPKLHREKKKMIAALYKAIAEIKKNELSAVETLIFNTFEKLAPTNKFFIVRYLAFRQFFAKHTFSTASAIDENSPATRCMLDAARSTGALSIGIQHGNIGDAQPAYLYTANDRKNRIMADLTLVWGNYWKEFLTMKSNFPMESVVVTGQIRTDIIPKLLTDSVKLKAGLSAEKPVAVFASQPIPDPVIRHKAALDVFTAFSHLPGYELVVKLHPAEKEALDYYNNIAREAGCTGFRLLYNVDLYTLLAAADLVITCYSTVGTEAVYFGKPLIILDHLKEDLLGYHSAGVAWQALNAADLEKLANGILKKEISPDMDAYQRFIDQYSFSIDGKATERTLSAIRAAKSGIAR